MLSSANTVVILAAGLVAYKASAAVLGLRQNIKIAQSTGFPYVVVPWSPWWIFGQITAKLWKPIVTSLPQHWWEKWIDVIVPNWAYDNNYQPFARLGDTHLLVSPFDVVLNTANAELIRQVAGRREHFPKKVETYDILRIFGDNVVTTEGVLWRMHRRAAAASFNERTAAAVFSEAVRQARGMLDVWSRRSGGGGGGGGDGDGGSTENGGHLSVCSSSSTTIRSLEHDTMRLALNIIGYAGFGMRLLWPGQELPRGTDPRWAKYGTLEPQGGYAVSFVDAVAGLLDNVVLVLMAPHWLLRILPFEKTRKTMEYYDNYKKYMDALLVDKREQMIQADEKVRDSEGMDLIGQLAGTTVRDPADPKAPPRPLSKDEILGNLFIMMVAGHETSANAIHFALVELACRPAAQRQLQRDVDAIFGMSDPDTWSYDAAVGALSASMVGAATNETLRKMPPVVEIPKGVALRPGEAHQVVTVDGRRHAIPDRINLSMVVSAVQRNPRYWPNQPSDISGKDHDLDDWVPERWFRTLEGSSGGGGGSLGADKQKSQTLSSPSSSPPPTSSSSSSRSSSRPSTPHSERPESNAGTGTGTGEDLDGFRGSDTSASLFRPERGAYIPFSEGPRACLGRRVAQVEILAALAVVFREHSLELAVDEWATDDEVAAMGRDDRAALYARAQEKCRRVLLTAGSIITLKLHGEHVPVRLARRGEERFVSWVE